MNKERVNVLLFNAIDLLLNVGYSRKDIKKELGMTDEEFENVGDISCNKRIGIEEQKHGNVNTYDFLNYLIGLIENIDEKYTFEWAVGSERPEMEIYDKEKGIGFIVKIEPIKYDENGNTLNL